jgi:outer membrane biosynthesis protein TonB
MRSSRTRKPLRQNLSETGEKQPFFGKTKAEIKKKDDVFFQTKLEVDDKSSVHEQQANTVAGKVQKAEEEKQTVPGKKDEEKDKPAVQKMDAKKEDEKAPQTKEKEKEPVQKMSEQDKKEESQVQKKEEEGRQTAVMAAGEAKGPSSPAHKSSLEEQIRASKGKGLPLPSDVRETLESAMNYDLSMVRIHTGNDAIEMNRELNSLAFTNENDIYFNEGKYQPYTIAGKALLAHEITHVIQQMGTSKKPSPLNK